MNITLLPSALPAAEGEASPSLTTYLVNDSLAVDAGCLGWYGSWREQARVKHVLLSHSHLDHVASLPLFLENVHQAADEPVTVYASEAVLECLRRDLFNGRLWPDLVALSRSEAEFLRLVTIEDGRAFSVAGLRITPCAVDHVVPTLGFLLEDDAAAVLLVSDTGPTQAIWDLANRTPKLRAVFLEASFPDSMAWLGKVAKHLTPATFAQEARKLARPVPVIAIHIKPRYQAQIVAELHALGLPGLEIARYGQPYCF